MAGRSASRSRRRATVCCAARDSPRVRQGGRDQHAAVHHAGLRLRRGRGARPALRVGHARGWARGGLGGVRGDLGLGHAGVLRDGGEHRLRVPGRGEDLGGGARAGVEVLAQQGLGLPGVGVAEQHVLLGDAVRAQLQQTAAEGEEHDRRGDPAETGPARDDGAHPRPHPVVLLEA
ncbi:hypothetical protein AB0L75_44595, partial [Streptomyces sp. NPDC052101]